MENEGKLNFPFVRTKFSEYKILLHDDNVDACWWRRERRRQREVKKENLLSNIFHSFSQAWNQIINIFQSDNGATVNIHNAMMTWNSIDEEKISFLLPSISYSGVFNYIHCFVISSSDVQPPPPPFAWIVFSLSCRNRLQNSIFQCLMDVLCFQPDSNVTIC